MVLTNRSPSAFLAISCLMTAVGAYIITQNIRIWVVGSLPATLMFDSQGHKQIDQDATTPPQPPLLALLGELRNKIWRYALLEEERKTGPGDDGVQPGVLRTTRQLRAETAAIYCTENAFVFTIRD